MSESLEAQRPTDETLAERAQNGCARSFEELMRRYQAALLTFLKSRTATDAEDLLQETFFRAFRGLAGYRPTRPLRPWIFAIARRVSIDVLRRPTAPGGSGAVDHLAGSDPPPSARLASEESQSQLWSLARAVLSEIEWTALWLHYAEGMPTGEIAAVLRRSRPAVKTMLCRARKQLAAHLSRNDGDFALRTAVEELEV